MLVLRVRSDVPLKSWRQLYRALSYVVVGIFFSNSSAIACEKRHADGQCVYLLVGSPKIVTRQIYVTKFESHIEQTVFKVHSYGGGKVSPRLKWDNTPASIKFDITHKPDIEKAEFLNDLAAFVSKLHSSGESWMIFVRGSADSYGHQNFNISQLGRPCRLFEQASIAEKIDTYKELSTDENHKSLQIYRACFFIDHLHDYENDFTSIPIFECTDSVKVFIGYAKEYNEAEARIEVPEDRFVEISFIQKSVLERSGDESLLDNFDPYCT